MANKSMFLHEYAFRGSQNEKAVALSSIIDNESNTPIFTTLIELFICGAVVGCYFGRHEKPEKGEPGKKIFADQFATHSTDLQIVLKLVLLTADKEHTDSVSRLSRTFRNRETDENYSILEEYALGGISVLYDALILDTNKRYEDYLTCVNKFLSQFSQGQDGGDTPEVSTDSFF
jgi:hypothetical protein